MEEIKNGIISEEALDEIAGGLRLPKITVKKVLTGAGILIGALAALGGATGLGYGAYKLATGKEEEGETPAVDDNQQHQTSLAGTSEAPGTQQPAVVNPPLENKL